MNLLAIDPGSAQSAYVMMRDPIEEMLDDGPVLFGIVDNAVLVDMLKNDLLLGRCHHLAIETLHVRGMPTAQAEMETQLWAGRFIQAADIPFTKIRRLDEKTVICGSARAKDGNIRQALIDMWGGERATKGPTKCEQCKGRQLVGLGKKRGPCPSCEGTGCGEPAGVLFGISADVWSALAIAVTWHELQKRAVAKPLEKVLF